MQCLANTRILICLLGYLTLTFCGKTYGQSTAVSESLKKISQEDGRLNAVIALNTEAEQQAKEIENGTPTLLAARPILVKDNIDVVGLPTTAGSLALKDNVAIVDAPIISSLKKHGAVILGKSNLSEWANFRSEKSSSGWSAIGGQTVNPHDEDRSPCGSSSGSAVAVAAGYVDIAIGTETNGSIVCPASINGIVGFKPTHGLLSNDGIVPLASSQDTAGPMASSIELASVTLSAMMLDSSSDDKRQIIEGLQNLGSGPALNKLRIGVVANTLGYDIRRDQILESAVARLRQAGVGYLESIELTPPAGFWEDNYKLLQYEFKRDLNQYFKSRRASVSNLTLGSLIEFNQDNAAQELRYFDQGIFEKAQSLELSESEYQRIKDEGHKVTREQGLDAVFDEHELDAVIGITVGPAWKIDLVNGDAFFGPFMSSYPAIGGHPHITVPGGKIADLPVGISFVGKRNQDDVLAQIVYRYSLLENNND